MPVARATANRGRAYGVEHRSIGKRQVESLECFDDKLESIKQVGCRRKQAGVGFGLSHPLGGVVPEDNGSDGSLVALGFNLP